MTRMTDGLEAERAGPAAVAALERAELEARERRLSAQAEADAILADAASDAAAIRAGIDARIDESLRALRDGYQARADAEIAAIGPATGTPATTERTARSPAFSAAVDRLVAAVLAEPEA